MGMHMVGGRAALSGCLLGLVSFATAHAASIDKFVTIQPIAVCDDAGASCADAAGILASTKAVTDAVWSQAGIAMTFLAPRQFNETDYLTTTVSTSSAATDEGRRLLRTPGQGQSDNPSTINMYFVPDLRNGATGGALNGFAFINGNGVIIGGAPRLDTIAHELGHVLGLDHATFGAGGANNVMTDGPSRTILPSASQVAPSGAGLAQLSAAQIAKAREPLFSVNQFQMALFGSDSFPGVVSREYVGYSPGGYRINTVTSDHIEEASFVVPGDASLPPASERLKTVRLRFLPGSSVEGLMLARYDYISLFTDPAADFGAGGALIASPVRSRSFFIDNAPAGPVVPCFPPAASADCPFIQWPLASKRVLGDGTVELFWQLDGDSFGQMYDDASYDTTPAVILPPATRALPPFTPWDDFLLSLWSSTDPFIGAVPAPFSALFEFTSGIASQGFFDESGNLVTLAPTTVTSFIGEPGYGFVADLRPDPDPAIEISLFGDGLPFDVPTPSTLGLFAAAIGTVASGLRARKRR